MRYKSATYIVTGVGLGLLLIGTLMVVAGLAVPAVVAFAVGGVTSAAAVILSRISA